MKITLTIDDNLLMRTSQLTGEAHFTIKSHEMMVAKDVKTPVAPRFNSVSNQAQNIAEKINLYNGNTEVLIDLKNLSQDDRTQIVAELQQKIDPNKLKNVYILND